MGFGYKNFLNGIQIIGKSISANSVLGDLEVLTSDNNLYFYNGTTNSALVSADGSQVLTNKTIDANLNTILNIHNANIEAGAAIDLTKLAPLTADRALASDSSGFIVVSTTTDTELGYVHLVTSPIQAQLDSKLNLSGGTLTGQLFIPDGSSSSPSIALTNSPNTGIYRVGSNILGLSANGSPSVNISADRTNILGYLIQGTSTDNTFVEAAVSGITQAYRTTLVAASTTNNAAVALGAYVNESTNNRRISMFVDDLNGTAGIQTEASTGIPVFWLIMNGDGVANWDVNGYQTVTNRRQIKFAESTANGTNTVALRAPTSISSDVIFDLPGADGTTGQVLTTNGAGRLSFTDAGSAEPRGNYLYNGNFDFWQRGAPGATIATGGTAYGADRWYVKNTIGGGGILNYARATGVSDGAKFGALVSVNVSGNTAGEISLNQVLENFDSLALYNQTASFQVKVKGTSNTNQIGIQFMYATSEAKLTTAIGSEVLASVNSSTFTTVTLSGQALGTAMTTSGVIGVRIRLAGVSTGNIYDSGNGFIAEQAMVNLGSVIAPQFQRQNKSIAEELSACQRFYEKSYNLTVNPGTASTTAGQARYRSQLDSGNADAYYTNFLLTSKRTTATVTYYNPNSGATGTARGSDGNNYTITTDSIGQNAITTAITSLPANVIAGWHFTADAEI